MTVPMVYTRNIINLIDWSLRLILIKGPKGVGKSTLMQQYIRQNYAIGDRHVLYCSADSGYFTTHTLVETADAFCRMGGRHLFIDEIHKYENWSREIKEIYDLHRDLRIVISGSSLLQLNDGYADLSRRLMEYVMPGLSFREFLCFDQNMNLPSVSLQDLLSCPNELCAEIRSKCRPLEFFSLYLQNGYYPYYFENSGIYMHRIEKVVNYTIDVELTNYRKISVGNTRKIKALLQLISSMVPYEVDIAKLSKSVSVERGTLLNYLCCLDEASIIRRLFTSIETVTDLQKPDKILLDNSNILYALSSKAPEIGTVRETFFCNQLASAGHKVEYGGVKSGDFRIDDSLVIEVGGRDKGFRQIENVDNSFIAADDIDSAIPRKIPLWAFGFLY